MDNAEMIKLLLNIEGMLKVLLRNSTKKVESPTETGYLSRNETCKRLGGISLPTLNEYTKSGKIKGYRIGRRIMYSPADITAALTAIKTNGKAGEVAA